MWQWLVDTCDMALPFASRCNRVYDWDMTLTCCDITHSCMNETWLIHAWLSHLLEDAIGCMNKTWFSSAVTWLIHTWLYEWDMTHSCMNETWLIHVWIWCMKSCLIHLLYRIFYMNKTRRNRVCEWVMSNMLRHASFIYLRFSIASSIWIRNDALEHGNESCHIYETWLIHILHVLCCISYMNKTWRSRVCEWVMSHMWDMPHSHTSDSQLYLLFCLWCEDVGSPPFALHHTATHCNILQHAFSCTCSWETCMYWGAHDLSGSSQLHAQLNVVCYSVLQCVAVCCSVLQCVIVCCSWETCSWKTSCTAEYL